MIDHVGIYGSRVAEGLSAFKSVLFLHVDLSVSMHDSVFLDGILYPGVWGFIE